MKYFVLPIVWFLSCQLQAQGLVAGKIRNLNNTTDVDFKIVFIRNNIRLDSSLSGTAGFYEQKVTPGLYNIELSKRDFQPVVLKAVYLNTGRTSINFSVRFNEFIQVKPTPIPPSATPHPITDSVKVAGGISHAWGFGDADGMTSSSPTITKSTSYAFTPSASYSLSKTHVAEKSKKSPSGDCKKGITTKHEDVPATEESVTIVTKAGQVTAGHWRDLDHWSQWLLTNQRADIIQHQRTWGFYPKKQIKLSFEDREGNPLTFTQVELLDENNQRLWQTRTDQEGKAYFWPSIFKTGSIESFKVRIGSGNSAKTIDNVGTFINTGNKIKTGLVNNNERKLEIGFLVDATGSMGDEIAFLQAELMDVINRVQKKNPCLSLYTGSVFYKDEGDEYVTKVLPLSDNPVNTIQFIGEQSATGGGDFPEAVDKAMQDGVEQLNWTEGNHPRIMFLLLDAPPHQDSGSVERMKKYTRLCAEKGIRIVPIAASGIDKTTEFLLKYMAIATNGEYIYITDDSKIGDSHLKPTGGESKVEYLNDLMVKIINNYSRAPWCVQQQQEIAAAKNDSTSLKDTTTRQEPSRHSEIIAGSDWYMKFFPNPAVQYLQIQFSEEVERISITDISGQTLFTRDNEHGTQISLDISDWASGIYVIHAVRNNETVSGKLLVMH